MVDDMAQKVDSGIKINRGEFLKLGGLLGAAGFAYLLTNGVPAFLRRLAENAENLDLSAGNVFEIKQNTRLRFEDFDSPVIINYQNPDPHRSLGHLYTRSLENKLPDNIDLTQPDAIVHIDPNDHQPIKRQYGEIILPAILELTLNSNLNEGITVGYWEDPSVQSFKIGNIEQGETVHGIPIITTPENWLHNNTDLITFQDSVEGKKVELGWGWAVGLKGQTPEGDIFMVDGYVLDGRALVVA